MNVILLTIDALRPDHLGIYGYRKNTSPRIDEIGSKAVVYENAYANGPFTPSSFISIMTSTLPLDYHHYLPLPVNTKTIAEVLKENGYHTAAFHSNAYLSRYYGYDRGFDFFKDFLIKERKEDESTNFFVKARRRIYQIIGSRLGGGVKKMLRRLYIKSRSADSKKIQPYETADKLNHEVLKWLNAHADEKFFLWVHYMDAHSPYAPPRDYIKLFNPHISFDEINEFLFKINEEHKGVIFSQKELSKIIDLYDAGIRYVDSMVGEVVDELIKLGLMEDTLLILTSDHGESFMERNRMKHPSLLYQENIKIPLIIAHPDALNTRFQGIVSNMDIPPTILDYCKLPIPKGYRGKSIFQKMKDGCDEGVYSESSHDERRLPIDKRNSNTYNIYSYTTNEYKIIYDEIENRYELYNLPGDPGETNNLFQIKKDELKEYKNILDKRINHKEKKVLKDKIKNLKTRGRI